MWLVIGDLHLTDRASDAHRFGIFDWIKKQQEKRNVAATFLLGDLTDQKDRHSATLVNKIVAGLVSLRPPVYIVRGNHDYKADQSNPFFDFLNHIDGLTFATNQMVVKHGKRVALIPHYRTQDEFNTAVKATGYKTDCFLVHQTFEGAIAESGVRLAGLSASPIELFRPPLGVYAGDVHRPQTQGIVTYVGCPYQVRFGDDFEPRSLFIGEDGAKKNLSFAAPHKHSLRIRGADNLCNNDNLMGGDKVKLVIELAREEAIEWKKVKQEVLDACKELGLEVHGIKLEVNTIQRREKLKEVGATGATFEQFCKVENLSTKIKKIGMEIVNGNKDVL